MTSARRLGWAGACVAFALGSGPASAQNSQSWTWCLNKKRLFPMDMAIRGCSAVIQSGTETQQNLALAFTSRGIAFYEKRDYDRAWSRTAISPAATAHEQRRPRRRRYIPGDGA